MRYAVQGLVAEYVFVPSVLNVIVAVNFQFFDFGHVLGVVKSTCLPLFLFIVFSLKVCRGASPFEQLGGVPGGRQFGGGFVVSLKPDDLDPLIFAVIVNGCAGAPGAGLM